MRRVSGANYLANAFGAGKNGYQDYNPSNGQAGTTPDAAALNAVQEELASFIETMGLPLNGNDNTQLRQAIAAYVSVALAPYETAAAAASDLANAIAGLDDASQVAAAITAALSSYAPLASPAFVGTPTAPTLGRGDNSTKLATTAWAQTEFGWASGSNANGDWRKAPDGWIEQSGFSPGPYGVTTFAVTFPIPFTVASQGRPNIDLAILDTDTSTADDLIAYVLSSSMDGFTCQLRQTTGGTPSIDGVYWSAKGR